MPKKHTPVKNIVVVAYIPNATAMSATFPARPERKDANGVVVNQATEARPVKVLFDKSKLTQSGDMVRPRFVISELVDANGKASPDYSLISVPDTTVLKG